MHQHVSEYELNFLTLIMLKDLNIISRLLRHYLYKNK